MTSEEELGKALKNNNDSIEITGDLSRRIIKINATGKVAWGACAVCLTGLIAATIVSLKGNNAKLAFIGAVAAVPSSGVLMTILGINTAISAIKIGAYGGGIGVLTKLRNYNLEIISKEKIILHRK